MTLDRLEVDQLRILSHLALDLEPGVNLVTGSNGAGKTTTLEAVHVLVRGRSFRRGGVDSQIQHGADNTAVRGRLASGSKTIRLDFVKRRGEPHEIQLDRRRVEKVSEVAVLVPLQTLLPDLTDLMLGAPAERRKWLDLGLLYEETDSLRAMAHFRHVLRQRNAALRMRQHHQLDAWDFELAASADALTTMRLQCFERMLPYVEECVERLCPEFITKLSFYPGHRGSSYAADLANQRERDIQLRMTNSGPHRADIHVRISSKEATKRAGLSVSTLASQGQARALAAALKLAQVRYFSTQGKQTLLLVDDLGSEWDETHCNNFMTLVSELNVQMIASVVDANILPKKWQNMYSEFKLNQGTLIAHTA